MKTRIDAVAGWNPSPRAGHRFRDSPSRGVSAAWCRNAIRFTRWAVPERGQTDHDNRRDQLDLQDLRATAAPMSSTSKAGPAQAAVSPAPAGSRVRAEAGPSPRVGFGPRRSWGAQAREEVEAAESRPHPVSGARARAREPLLVEGEVEASRRTGEAPIAGRRRGAGDRRSSMRTAPLRAGRFMDDSRRSRFQSDSSALRISPSSQRRPSRSSHGRGSASICS